MTLIALSSTAPIQWWQGHSIAVVRLGAALSDFVVPTEPTKTGPSTDEAARA